jgi:hypothetical protein
MSDFIQNVILKSEPSIDQQKKLIAEKHQENHNGPDMMFRAIFREGFYWKSLYTDCEKECGSCDQCLRFNVGKVGFHPLASLSAAEPWDHIVIDLIGPFITTEDGFNFVLIVVDVLTRFIVLRPIQSKSAEEIAMTLLHLFADFGAPKIMQCDRDKSFLNQITAEMRNCIGFEMRGIMKYFPRTNGLVERNVHETKQLLHKWLRGDISGWKLRIPAVQLSLNDRVLSSTKSKAFSLMFARQLNGFADFRNIDAKSFSVDELMAKNEKMLVTIFPEMSKVLKDKRSEDLAKANKKAKGGKRLKPFIVGDKVMKAVDNRTETMQQRFEGPFTIVEFHKASKGFRLLDSTGHLLKGYIPAEHLKIIEHAEPRNEADYAVVHKIKAHRGSHGNREYLVKWKGKHEDSWVHELDFDAFDLIRKYWQDKVQEPLQAETVNAQEFIPTEPTVGWEQPAPEENQIKPQATRAGRQTKPNRKFF